MLQARISILAKGKSKTIAFELPEKWAEVKPSTIMGIAHLLFTDSANNRIEICKQILPKKVLHYFLRMDPFQVFDITKQLDWMYETGYDKPCVTHFYTDKGNKYYLPMEWLRRCNIIEFTFADKFFEAIVAGDSSKIDNLILSLCRPKRTDFYKPDEWNGDIRERFNPVLIDERIQEIKKMPDSFKLYFLWFFISCKKTIAKRYPVLFKSRVEEKVKNPYAGWLSVIWDLAGDITQEEKVQYSNLHNILAFLVKKHFDNEAQKQNQ